MRKSLKKSRKPIGAIFRHAVNKISPNSEKLILEALTNIKKTVPDPLKKAAKEVSQEASNVQQRNPLDKYDTFDKKTQVSPLFSVDPRMRPIFQINNQILYPHQLDQQALSKVLPMFKLDQQALSKVLPIFQQTIQQAQQKHSDGGSTVRNNKIGYFKSKSKPKQRFTIFNKSRRHFN